MTQAALPRRLLLGAPALLIAGRAGAQSSRPLTLVVPYAAGGGTDIAAREFAQGFGEALGGRTVIVDNRGGAGGHVGSTAVARSAPDGSTLLFAVSTNIVVNPHLQRGDRMDLAAALTPVTQTSAYQYVLVVDPQVPARTLTELIAWAKAQPRGSVTYSSAGWATPTTWPACSSPRRPGWRWSTCRTAAPARRCWTWWPGGSP